MENLGQPILILFSLTIIKVSEEKSILSNKKGQSYTRLKSRQQVIALLEQSRHKISLTTIKMSNII